MATWFIESSILVKQSHAFHESKEVNLFGFPESMRSFHFLPVPFDDFLIF